MMNKIKHNLRFALFILLFFQGTILFSQNTIKGIVCDTDGLVIPCAHVLLCLNDSIIAQSISTEHGFLLENIPENSYILNVSHVGYQIKKISLDVKSNIDLDSIQLSLLTLELDEVVIRTIHNVTTYKNNQLHINVKQTYLSKLPDVQSLLNNIPGVFQTDNKLMYFGKGQVLLLINGREIKSTDEINSLQPSQIKEIIVDHMPGAKYDSRYSSVLDIKTTSEKPALTIYNTTTWARHYSGKIGFNSQNKINGTLIDFGYSFRRRKNTLYSKQIEESYQTGNEFERFFMDTTSSNRQSHDWNIGTQTKFKTSTLALKYSGYYSLNKPVYSSFMQYTSNSCQENFNIQRDGKYKEQQHLVTLDYSAEFDSNNNLRITADYLYQNSKDNSHALENSIESEKQTYWDFQGKYNIYSLLTEYEHSFSKSIKLITGMRYSHVYNMNDSKENDISSQYKFHENRCAFYAEGSFRWQKITMLLGLRSEWFSKECSYTVQGKKDYKDLFFLPSLSISYQPSEDLHFSLSGTNKVSLPSFGELTPIVTYLNQYSYIIGNPLLKPTTKYDFGFDITWKNKFNVKFEYNLLRNDRISCSIPDETNNQVLKYTYVNLKKSGQFSGMLTYSDYLFNRHTINFSTGILIPNAKIPYRDGTLYRSTPSYYAQIFTNWKLSKIIDFAVSYIFQSKSYDKADTYSATHNLGCNLSIVPIKNRLFINLQVNDILKKTTGNWETNYGYIRTQQFNNADSRNITLSLRYVFNSFKSIKHGSSNSEEIDRL